MSTFEQRGNEIEDVLCDDLIASSRGVGVVALHHAGRAVDVLQEEGQQAGRGTSLRGSVGLVELLDVVGAVVGREGDAGEGDLDPRFLEGGDDGVEVGAGVFDAEAAKAVVAAELDDGDRRGGGRGLRQAGDAVFGGVAADAEVDDAVVEGVLVEVGLEVVGVAVAGSVPWPAVRESPKQTSTGRCPSGRHCRSGGPSGVRDERGGKWLRAWMKRRGLRCWHPSRSRRAARIEETLNSAHSSNVSKPAGCCDGESREAGTWSLDRR